MRHQLAANANVRIFTEHRVTAVKYHPGRRPGEQTPVAVRGERPRSGNAGYEGFGDPTYSHVLFTIPPPCLLAIDLSACRMDLLQRDAVRQVSIGPSCKIGMKFNTPWWSSGQHGLTINGGQSSTDRPVRTVVYPSYGGGQSTTLITSYTWCEYSSSDPHNNIFNAACSPRFNNPRGDDE